MPREVLLDGRVERLAEIYRMLRRHYYLTDELAGGRVRAQIGKLYDHGVVGDGDLGRIAKRWPGLWRYGDGDRRRVIVFHVQIIFHDRKD